MLLAAVLRCQGIPTGFCYQRVSLSETPGKVDIKYDSFGPYYLSVVEEGMDVSRFPFSTKRRYYIYVGKDSGKPVYGHVIDYSFHPDTSDIYNIAQHIKKSDVVWSEEGVSFNEASGHKVFIPKSMIRGR